MTFVVECPSCSQTLKATDQHIGRRAKCPKCGGSVTIGRSPVDEHSDVPIRPPVQVPPTVLTPPDGELSAATRNQRRTFSLPVLVGTAVATLVLGYSVGREHVKYAMRSAFSEAGKALEEDLQQAFNVNHELAGADAETLVSADKAREELMETAKKMDGVFAVAVADYVAAVEGGSWPWSIADEQFRQGKFSAETTAAYRKWRAAKLAESDK